MTCYVYVIEAGNFVKVGFSNDPDKRLKEMQTGSPHSLKIAMMIPCDTRDAAYQLEKEFHEKLKLWHHRGEWFKRDCLNIVIQTKMPIMRNQKRQHRRDKMFNNRAERIKREHERQQAIDDFRILTEARARI